MPLAVEGVLAHLDGGLKGLDLSLFSITDALSAALLPLAPPPFNNASYDSEKICSFDGHVEHEASTSS